LKSQQGDRRPAPFQPVVRAAIDVAHLPFAPTTRTALPMGRWAALAWRTHPRSPQPLAQGLAADGDPLDLAQLLGEVMVIEAGIGGTRQAQDALVHCSGSLLDFLPEKWEH
jgi:hypothetical protein